MRFPNQLMPRPTDPLVVVAFVCFVLGALALTAILVGNA